MIDGSDRIAKEILQYKERQKNMIYLDFEVKSLVDCAEHTIFLINHCDFCRLSSRF